MQSVSSRLLSHNTQPSLSVSNMVRDLLVVSCLLLSLLQGLAVREKRDYDTCDSVDELFQTCITKY